MLRARFHILIGEGGLAVTLLSASDALAKSGLTWQSAAALIGAVASLVFGCATLSRELRAWWRPGP